MQEERIGKTWGTEETKAIFIWLAMVGNPGTMNRDVVSFRGAAPHALGCAH